MKVTLNWLKQYVDIPWSPEELTERLTLLGVEVEGVQKIDGEWDGVVVAQIVTRDKHPNADKLSLCRVNDGTGERQIVCGAQNFKVGDKVPLILPGASLPMKLGDKELFTIKVGKIRGIESHGMLCSHEELGIDPESIGHCKEDGLLLLRETAVVGQSLASYLGRSGSDVVYDLEITPNRPDLTSLIGIAREIAAITGQPLRLPECRVLLECGVTAASLVSVSLEAPDLCPRYTARIIRGVKVGPSPVWLRSALEKVGVRSINNVVDVSNYVLLETGHPLHTFDYSLIAAGAGGKPSIVVRRAVFEESFTTLDGRAHRLGQEALLIADAEKGIALAGLMGGSNSEIRESTVDVLIESAYFSPASIRRTSKALGVRTDASYRFERGADVGICDYASRRCAALILETAGGQLAEGSVEVYPSPFEPHQLALRYQRTDALTGTVISPEEQSRILIGLGLVNVTPIGGSVETATWLIPTWRVDLKREVDLIEEVVRVFGVGRIPSTQSRRAQGSHPADAHFDRLTEVRRLLSGLGLDEAQGQTLVAEASARWVTEGVVLLSNPLSSEMNALRPSLLPGLLDTLRHNLSRRNGDVQLFEIGRVFVPHEGGLREGWRLALALTGARAPRFWSGLDRDARCDIPDLKGLIEEVIERIGLRGIAWIRRAEPTSLFIESASIALGGKLALGQLGQLQPQLGKLYDLRDGVFLAELDLDLLFQRGNSAKSFKPLAQFPSIQRDLAMIVVESTTHDAVLAVIKQAKPAHLETMALFDVFRGKHVPEGRKSLAYSFTYRAADRTLKDDEVNAAHGRVIEAVKEALGAVLRD
ncbi:MAG: phenylalanine--tRNA ligase subunit beta [Pedosphaera sp.]|nr:phenylalanine--tRNA ligase subunit beta [Pedosphaera sp.]